MQIICMRSLCKSFLTTVAFISLKQHGLVSHQHKVTMKELMMSRYSCVILKCFLFKAYLMVSKKIMWCKKPLLTIILT